MVKKKKKEPNAEESKKELRDGEKVAFSNLFFFGQKKYSSPSAFVSEQKETRKKGTGAGKLEK